MVDCLGQYAVRDDGAHPLGRRELNALRRLLNRPDVTLDAVAELGIGALFSAPGLGAKGFARVCTWLTENGYPVTTKNIPHERLQKQIKKELANSTSLLQFWGWKQAASRAGNDELIHTANTKGNTP